jgi:hypothetical protein
MGDTETTCHAVFEVVYFIRGGLVAVSGFMRGRAVVSPAPRRLAQLRQYSSVFAILLYLNENSVAVRSKEDDESR